MNSHCRHTSIIALSTLVLTLMVLIFVARNPWMLAGVAAVLLAIAAIVRAINNGPHPDDQSSTQHVGPETKPPVGDKPPPETHQTRA